MITVEQIRALPDNSKAQFFKSLNKEEKYKLLYTWEMWAREGQLEPEELGKNGKFIWFAMAGRGWGKTRVFVEWLIKKIQQDGYRHITLAGAAADEVRDIMIEGESGILENSPPWFYPMYEPSKKKLTWPNGAIAKIVYGSEPNKSRGMQSDLIWADEIAKWKHPEETFDNLMMGLRLGKNPLCGVSSTPKPTKFIKNLGNREETILTIGTTMENVENLAPPFLKTIVSKYKGTRLGKQELEAKLLDDNPNALWSRVWLDEYRIKNAPEMYKVIVAIDPSVSDPKETAENNAECGIVVVGEAKVKGEDEPHYFVIEDLSIMARPLGWARKAVSGYKVHMADRIIAEKNNGGEMVKDNLHNVDSKVPVSLVWASRGKHTRAEPVSSLYEQGRVHHVGTFDELEDQLCEWEPGMKSPDRLDAVVWGISWLAGFDNAPATIRTKQLTSKTRSKVF